jgi:hypothetical protein
MTAAKAKRPQHTEHAVGEGLVEDVGKCWRPSATLRIAAHSSWSSACFESSPSAPAMIAATLSAWSTKAE